MLKRIAALEKSHQAMLDALIIAAAALKAAGKIEEAAIASRAIQQARHSESE